ncbi:MAG: ABC transporter permease [Alphaproteobacteria bacterium]
MTDTLRQKLLPVLTIVAAIGVIWYGFTVYLNAPWQLDQYEKSATEWSMTDLVRDTMAHDRPVLPAPHQVVAEIWKTTVKKKVTSKRSLIYHSWITLSSTLLGFVMGTFTGMMLAIFIVENRAMDKSLMPWIITSQTIPILAIAPMIIVVLNAVGLSGLLPKALISTYLSFFPIAVGMVKGLRSPDPMLIDLMRTYNCSRWQLFFTLRLPSSVPYLFTSMKIAIAISLVGAIVGELPTGAVAGLGARLLSGSYYGQTIQIWSALLTAATLAALLVIAVNIAAQITQRMMGVPK